ncbi:SGNH/GDSL hydrolase family protein [Galactobacter caseinivorans]|uniref:SGNH/GDSL hydrolase family protein n=1 Tax=Galactobacter caseinivorans TaxID=2676123 RepID=A0A496PJN9_9MICC|nr:SGNH/GDSL hydrolase family protein [Galactobacter caseinivorans]
MIVSDLNPSEDLHPWRRFVAIGDSFTEGIGDPDPTVPGGNRGWADRVAEQLASASPDFSYANLAVRGRLIGQINDEQVEAALELQPDLITLCAGGNDVTRGGNPDFIADELDSMVKRLSRDGATVVLFTGPDIGETPVLGTLRGRVAIFNENVHTVALRHDAVIADLWALRQLHQKPMWAPDRLHFSALGHHTIAAMVLDSLGVQHSLDPTTPEPAASTTWRQARAGDIDWAREHLFPWVMRRVRHQSSGDGVSAKRPLAAPVFGKANGPVPKD